MSGLGNKIRIVWSRFTRRLATMSLSGIVNVFLCVALIFIGWLAFDARGEIEHQQVCTHEYLQEDRVARDARTNAVADRDEALVDLQLNFGNLLDTISQLGPNGQNSEEFIEALEETRVASDNFEDAQIELDQRRENNDYPPFPNRFCEVEEE